MNEHPMYQLWKLRKYLSRYKPDGQTILVHHGYGDCAEYAFTSGYRLGDDFARLHSPYGDSIALMNAGLDPMKRGKVYGYILRRKPEFVDNLYGWGIDRFSRTW